MVDWSQKQQLRRAESRILAYFSPLKGVSGPSWNTRKRCCGKQKITEEVSSVFERVCVGGDGELSVWEAKNVTHVTALFHMCTQLPHFLGAYRMKIVGQFLEGHRSFKIVYILDM